MGLPRVDSRRNAVHRWPINIYGYRYAINGAGNHEGTAIGGTESPLPFRITGPQVTANLEYDSSRNVLVSRTNTYPNGTLSKFAYTVNAIGQRTALSPSGDAFPEGYPRKTTDWGYNERGELVSSKRDTDTWTYRAYSFDAIGNRITATVQNADITSYFADQAKTDPGASALNQYGAITFPTSPTLTIEPLHDADGNLTHGPVAGPSGLIAGVPGATTASVPTPTGADLQWDAENRLIRAEVGEAVVTYAYDHLSRLIARTQSGVTIRYLYDGWNRIAEYKEEAGSHSLLKTYLWGLDLSGATQGAGGVSGLLCVLDILGSTGHSYPAFDGNGNVSEYLDNSGAQIAHFEYDPFGNLTADTSSNASDFAFRFSTKPQDPVTGLLYYGYRFYDPLTGRWPSRDPIGEEGGVNLYGFVGNDDENFVDSLGLVVVGCNLEETFDAAGVNGYIKIDISFDGAMYLGPATHGTGLFGEILQRMIGSSRVFTVKDGTNANLVGHVQSRITIVNTARRFAEKLLFTKPGGHGPNVNNRFADPANALPADPTDLLRRMIDDPSKFEMGCLRAALFAARSSGSGIATGIETRDRKDWVPGDWGYITNKTHNKKDPADWAQEGENIIYLGDGLFWGHNRGTERIMTGDQWWYNVDQKFHSKNGASLEDQRAGPVRPYLSSVSNGEVETLTPVPNTDNMIKRQP